MVAVITQVCIFTYRLLNEINLKSPGSSRPLGGSLSDTPTDGTAVGGAGVGSSGGKGQRKPRVKSGGKDASELSLTPSRHSSSSGPMPHACSDAVPKSMTADMDNASLNTKPVPMETRAVPMDEGSEIAVSSSSVQEQLSPLNLLSPTVPALATNSEVIVTASATLQKPFLLLQSVVPHFSQPLLSGYRTGAKYRQAGVPGGQTRDASQAGEGRE